MRHLASFTSSQLPEWRVPLLAEFLINSFEKLSIEILWKSFLIKNDLINSQLPPGNRESGKMIFPVLSLLGPRLQPVGRHRAQQPGGLHPIVAWEAEPKHPRRSPRAAGLPSLAVKRPLFTHYQHHLILFISYYLIFFLIFFLIIFLIQHHYERLLFSAIVDGGGLGIGTILKSWEGGASHNPALATKGLNLADQTTAEKMIRLNLYIILKLV